MRQTIPDEWNIPSQLRERFGDAVGRQRAMTCDGHLLIVLHETAGPNDRKRIGKILWRDPRGNWRSSLDGNVTNLLKKHLVAFEQLVDKFEGELKNAEQAGDYFQLMRALGPLHRTSRNLHATLQQAREMVPLDRDIIVARDTASDIERAFELLHADAKNGLDYLTAHKAELQSERSLEMALSAHRLNILAALFFPLTAFSSIFGMNCASGFERTPGLFWGVLTCGLLSGLITMRLIIRTKEDSPAADPIKRISKTNWSRQKKMELVAKT